MTILDVSEERRNALVRCVSRLCWDEGEWTGRPAELLAKLAEYRTPDDRAWPESAVSAGLILATDKVQKMLAEEGIVTLRERRNYGHRWTVRLRLQTALDTTRPPTPRQAWGAAV